MSGKKSREEITASIHAAQVNGIVDRDQKKRAELLLKPESELTPAEEEWLDQLSDAECIREIFGEEQ